MYSLHDHSTRMPVAATDHAFVLVLAPAGGHAVVVLEEVARLVHQRRVAPARQHEPLPAPVVPARLHAHKQAHTQDNTSSREVAGEDTAY